MSHHETDTIAAVATGLPGAVGILRLSGPQAIQAAQALFRPADGRPLNDHAPRTVIYGDLTDGQGRLIDRILCTFSRGPASYTGEDTAELQCHGSPLVLQLGLEALFAQGARQALPGEFTRRAFLNGRLDLAQAEAVVDLIDAQTREGVLQSAGQLAGALSRRVEEIYSGLVDLMAHFHAVLDYPDEDIDPFRAEQMQYSLDKAAQQLDALLATHRRGQSMVSGLPCAIVGRPNAGKSSLLNALVGYDRAIVTDIPGTTRDTVEERVRLGGVLLRLIDTAGLRESADPIEQKGVERSRAAMEGAAIILFLCDRSVPFTREDGQLLERAMACAPTVLVWNKSDLTSAPVPFLDLPQDVPVAHISARTGQGLEELEQAVAKMAPPAGQESAGALLTNARQADAARRALEAVELARRGLEAGFTPDAVLVDVENALSALGELTGRAVRQDITDRIFERFCVGK
ncbi:MAG: tRNA uridine-5-carboxymethylaminomethyl(34) synthesis GTPase MnmE [Oscillospiraceae bacterium]|nr:tRNA uridine-5-carboxymethylaminomethyl(34) synthesis GTPase MnmE [Oscillospiraceae bacterium]